MGYPTQKPEALLERIIRTSSNEGDTLLDPFCGCGTAIAVAEKLKRHWVGIDVTYLAINLVQRRLRDSFAEQLSPYEIIGAPTDLQGAEALKEISPHQFEWWAVDMVDARPAKDHKKGADTGIDGYINFFDDKSGQAKQVIVQVKSGHIGVNHVRDLKGVLEREKAPIGALITLREPTGPMLIEATAAGFYEPKEFPVATRACRSSPSRSSSKGRKSSTQSTESRRSPKPSEKPKRNRKVFFSPEKAPDAAPKIR